MFDLSGLFTAENVLALVTLSALEIVLGIDNVVFISILTGKLEESRQKSARRIGLAVAMVSRILLLLAIGWVMGLTEELFTLSFLTFEQHVTGRDIVLFIGGLFLIGKATFEIHDKIEGDSEHGLSAKRRARYGMVILQIMLLDIVFSLDSVITAVGMAQHIVVMITAVIIAVGVMLVFAEVISAFVNRHPTLKMLALSFLVLIGVMLVAEGLHHHIPKGYIYFAMAFSVAVEMLNLRVRARRGKPVKLHKPASPGGA